MRMLSWIEYSQNAETILKSSLRIGKELTFTAMDILDIKSLWIRLMQIPCTCKAKVL